MEAAFEAPVKYSGGGIWDPGCFSGCGNALISSLTFFSKSLNKKRKEVGRSRNGKKNKGEEEGKKKEERRRKGGKKEKEERAGLLVDLQTTH